MLKSPNSEQAVSEQLTRLINSVLDRVKDDLSNWFTEVWIKYESELTSVVDETLNKYSSAISEVDRAISLDREYKLYDASMRIKQEYLMEVDEVVNEAKRIVKERIVSMRGSKQYEDFLRALMRQALDIVQASEVSITCSPDDYNVVKGIADEYGVKATIKADEKVLGLIVSTIDGSITYSATIDDILSRIEDYMRWLLREVISGVVR